MKRVIIVHGWDGSPKEAMHSWMKKELKKKGFEVIAPKMPNPAKPQIEKWIPFFAKVVGKIDKDTYFIGHSIGCQTILRYLERAKENIKVNAVFIAPWLNLNMAAIAEEGEEAVKIANSWINAPIDLGKIKQKINNLACIFSEDDPVVPIENKNLFKEKLGAKIILEKNKGHFTEDDGVKENKTAVEELLKLVK